MPVAGIGNVYANEALFRARIHPLRAAASLKRTQIAALREAVVGAPGAGLDAGGAWIDDFCHPGGLKGTFQNEFFVHAREGEPCLACGAGVVKFVAAGRGTYACALSGQVATPKTPCLTTAGDISAAGQAAGSSLSCPD